MEWIKTKCSTLRRFCSTAYAHIPNQDRSKLDDKSANNIFISYDLGSNDYKLYNQTGGKTIITRDDLMKAHGIGSLKKKIMISSAT